MRTKIDLLDKKILYQLDLNARGNNTKISKKVRLSKDAVGYRINKLEEQRIIRGYRAIIDSSRLGYLFYRVFFNLIDMKPGKKDELIHFLKKQKNVWWIARLDGAWDFVFAIWVKSNKEFQEFYNSLNLKFRENIKDRLICPIISYENLNKKYLFEGKKETKTTSVGAGDIQKIDKIDLQILEFLAEDARTLLIEIAHKLKLDSMTIFHRIKKLENSGIIQGYKADIDTRKIGRDFYSVKINLRDVSKMEEIRNSVLSLPEAIATTKAIGSYDIEFDLEVESSEKYYQIIEDLQKKFNFIREIFYFRVLENCKILYMPEL
jgi:Lrp/AsnC family transcriptional regulator, leucine-responsive regulatory protein